MGGYAAGAPPVDGAELFAQDLVVAGAEPDGLQGRGVVLGTEGHDESLVLQVTGILLQYRSGVAGGDEFHAADAPFAQGIGRFHQVALEVREVAFRIVGQEGIGGNAAGGTDDIAHGLHGQEGFRILGYEGGTARFEQFRTQLILGFRGILGIGIQGHAEGLGQMPFPQLSLGQGFLNLIDIQLDILSFVLQPVVEFGAHSLHLGVGLGFHLFQLALRRARERGRAVKPFSAQVGAARVVRVVHPQAGGLVFLVQRDELDIEKGKEVAHRAFLFPLSITVHRIKIVDADYPHPFG